MAPDVRQASDPPGPLEDHASQPPPGRKKRAKERSEKPDKVAQGFISVEDVQQKRAQLALMDAEPSAQELTLEAERMAQKPEGRSARKKASAGAMPEDMLASYMGKLSHLPLFTPEQEQQEARKLEAAELLCWRHVLEAPRACELLLGKIEGRDEPLSQLIGPLGELLDSYRRAAARSHKKHLADAPARQKDIGRLSALLRSGDFDKDLLEGLMAALRPEVWSRRVLLGSQAFRFTHADLTELERARGASIRLRNAFARANLRLVISVARRFHHYRLPFIDLIQEGNVGLLKAVHRFDHNRGFRFSTYAHWWIRQSIERALINKGSQVRLPVHVIDARRQISRATQQLTHNLGRHPTLAEIATNLETSADKVEQVLAGVQQDPFSLDEPVGGDDQRKFLDLMHDSESDPIDESLIRENSHARVRELLHLLGPIERDIIRRRFGLGCDSDQTLDDIGRLYNLSRERVRQIQAQGLSKMRRMCKRRKIG